MRLRDDAYWHAIHARKEVSAKGRGKLTNPNFVKALIPNEFLVFLFLERSERIVPSDRKVGIGGVRPGPETFAESTTDRGDKGFVRMGGEKLLEVINENRSNDGKKGRMTINSIERGTVGELVG